MRAPEPHLHHVPLALFGQLPQDRRENVAGFVHRQRVPPVPGRAAKRVAVKRMRLRGETPQKRPAQAERAHRVIDPDQLDLHPLVTPRRAKRPGLLAVGRLLVEPVEPLERFFADLCGPQQPQLVDEPRQRPHGEGTPRIAHQVDPVAGTVIARKEQVGTLDLPVDADPGQDLDCAPHPAPLDPGLVVEHHPRCLAQFRQEPVGQADIGFRPAAQRRHGSVEQHHVGAGRPNLRQARLGVSEPAPERPLTPDRCHRPPSPPRSSATAGAA